MNLNRRTFLGTSALGVSAGLGLSSCAVKPVNRAEFATFRHGVASGDPLTDRVMLWTRVTPEDPALEHVEVQWRVFTDPQRQDLFKQGRVVTGPARDYTVKLDATGLLPGQDYYYEFSALGHTSILGRTHSVRAEGLDNLNFAVVSCANYVYGYFNVYETVADNDELDLVIFLGDYLYEYGNSPAKKTPKPRQHLPDREITRLQDYRERHAQYKTDPQLQAAHARHPFIAVWDDHESANDSWKTGAQNHNPEASEGSWAERKRAAIRAYFEWMPIRAFPEDPVERIYRSFSFGDLADLLMLDTRLDSRTQQAPDDADPLSLEGADRHMLGRKQANWLEAQLQKSQRKKTKWRLLGQQVMFGQLVINEKILNMDQWDGYPGSREQVLDMLESNDIDNVVILTGDIHSAWGLDVSRDPFTENSRSLAIELIAPSVTSPSVTDPAEAKASEARVKAALPHLRFVDLYNHGYLNVSLSRARLTANWVFVDTVLSRNYKTSSSPSFMCESGSGSLTNT